MTKNTSEAPKTETTEATKPAKVVMPEQNGITQPKAGTSCAAIWDKANAMSSEIGKPVAVGDLMKVLVAEGYNEATIKTQYARWRKFHGVEGRIESEASRTKKAERDAAKTQRETDRLAKKAERDAEKERKAKERAAAKEAKDAEKVAKAEAKAKEKAEKEAAKQKAADAQAQSESK